MVPLENSATISLSFLFQRLKWPVPMSRWRTAKEIRNLLNEPSTQSSTTDALLDYLDQCTTESEVCEILTIVFLTLPASRPAHASLVKHIHHPSILADVILERTYGHGCSIGGWDKTHSGQAPVDFKAGHYFEEHKTSHVPPIIVNHLRQLEQKCGYPLQQHWAYEWKTQCDKLGTHYTRYPHYFDNVAESRAGIIGQYWQRMREVYLSAYLRTLAYAVSVLHMPQKLAEGYCLDVVHGIAGLFDVEPGTRPVWLSDIPERLCTPEADFKLIIHELVQAARVDGMRLVSLDTPVKSSVQRFANLTLSVHLITPEYELPEGASLYERLLLLPITDTFELQGIPDGLDIDETSTEGKTGDEVAVCGTLFPLPFGIWQSDYFSMGLRIPTPYTIPDTKVRCTHESIDCVTSDGKLASKTLIWNDNWISPYPKGGSTRCGTATMIDQEVLAETMERLGRKLAYFIQLRIWNREEKYGDYVKSERTYFLLDR